MNAGDRLLRVTRLRVDVSLGDAGEGNSAASQAVQQSLGHSSGQIVGALTTVPTDQHLPSVIIHSLWSNVF